MFRNLSPKALGVSGGTSEIIELALSFGFKGIELDVVGFAEQVKTHGLPHARRLLDSAKLKLGSFELPVDWRHGDEEFRRDLDKLAAFASLAAELGCLRCVTLIEPACDERHYHQNFEFHRQRLTDIAKKLEPFKIRLGVGFQAAAELRQGKAFEFIHNLDALLMLISMLGTKQVGVVLDTWDLRTCGGNVEAIRKITAERLIEVRLANAAGDAPTDQAKLADRVFAGEPGPIDLSAFLVALAEVGYDGPITPAPHPRHFAGMGREKIVRQVGQQFEQVWKAAGLTPAGKLAAATATARR